ncbi:MAG: hypothetical protein L0K12_15405 [Brevibacterium aurantiacum]|nr:hypothetical protein [Brevibacterium aurantiacum]
MSAKKHKERLTWIQRVRRWEIGDIHPGPMAPVYKSYVERVDKRVKDAADSLEFSDRIHLHPWKQGLWVSVQTGRTYRGNGGKERDEWALEKEGPWVLVAEDDAENLVSTYDLERATEHAMRLQGLIEQISESINQEIKEQ